MVSHSEISADIVRPVDSDAEDQHDEKRSGHPVPPLSANRWALLEESLDIALQPVVNLHTGVCYGYEALMRNYELAGFHSVAEVLDCCAAHGRLTEMEGILRDKALRKFARLPHQRSVRLFLNMDYRTFAEIGSHRRLSTWLVNSGVELAQIAIEISERDPRTNSREAGRLFAELKADGGHVAIDDFGAGFAGLQVLYVADPDFLKIDRSMIDGLARDSKRKMFLSHVLVIAHLLGMTAIAEWVETEEEYFTCKEIGCDLLQGMLIQAPTLASDELLASYPLIEELTARDRRAGKENPALVRTHVRYIEPIRISSNLDAVFCRFKSDKRQTFFPVVDAADEPLGLVREEDFKDFTYSYYGRDLITNKGFGRKLGQFITRCPIADINASADTILQTYATIEEAEGILVVDNRKYVGFLGARSLLRLINEKSMSAARDQNPLTKLPGNNVIYEYVSKALEDIGVEYTACYFDFDNFKPFNDKYGFRLGDRAILLFAELMNKVLPEQNCFVGHIGGDDFFAGLRDVPRDVATLLCSDLIKAFRREVESFYSEEDRTAGYIAGVDRQGNPARFPLLGVSAALLHLMPERRRYSLDEISSRIAGMKKDAKHSPLHLHIETHGAAE